MKILQVNGSARRTGAHSTRLAEAITARLKAGNPNARIDVLDLARTPHPVLDEAALAALATPAELRTPEQAIRASLDMAQVDRLMAADVIVLGVPMYNFGISAQLKAWFDAIAKAGVTFRYTASGPEGLVKGKRVFVALARGGIHRDTPTDAQVPYLRTFLGFLGMTDVEFVYAEGLALGAEQVSKAFAEAEVRIGQLIG